MTCDYCKTDGQKTGFCSHCGTLLYFANARFIYGPTINDSALCEFKLTTKYIIVKRLSTADTVGQVTGYSTMMAVGGIVGGLVGVATDAAIEAKNFYAYYDLKDIETVVYPYSAPSLNKDLAIKLINRDGSDFIIYIDQHKKKNAEVAWEIAHDIKNTGINFVDGTNYNHNLCCFKPFVNKATYHTRVCPSAQGFVKMKEGQFAAPPIIGPEPVFEPCDSYVGTPVHNTPSAEAENNDFNKEIELQQEKKELHRRNDMLGFLTTKKDIRSFSVTPENLTGEKGKGGMATEGSASWAARELGQGWKVNPYLVIKPGETATLADIKGQGAIKHIWITDVLPAGRLLLLRIYFDGHEHPSVEAPLSDFFCNADANDYRQLSSLAVCVNPAKGMNSYFEMPYFSSFRVEVENIGENVCNLYYQIDCEEKILPEDTLYFHARFNCINPLPYKENYVILDKIKGQGHYVGTYIHWGVKSNGWWGEGEVKFYIDGDSDFPTICGTGTEDYFCGSCNFDVGGYREYCTPYAGLHKVGTTDSTYKAQRFFDMYRWHITDPVYFKEDLKVTVQALGWRRDGRYLPLQDEISSVAYWYSDTLCDEYVPLPDKDIYEIH